MGHRVQLDFSESGMEEVRGIKGDSGCRTISGTIRNALALYRWYLDSEKLGDELLIRSKSTGQVERMRLIFLGNGEGT